MDHINAAINSNISNSLLVEISSSKHQFQNNHKDIYANQWNCKKHKTRLIEIPCNFHLKAVILKNLESIQ